MCNRRPENSIVAWLLALMLVGGCAGSKYCHDKTYKIGNNGLRISFVDKEITYVVGDTLYVNIEVANNTDRALKFRVFGESSSLWIFMKDWLIDPNNRYFIGVGDSFDSAGIVKLNSGEQKSFSCAFVQDDEALKDIPSGTKYEFQLYFRQNFYEDSVCFEYKATSTNELTITIHNPQK